MNKVRFWILISAILFLGNLILFFQLFNHGVPHFDPEQPKKTIIKRLELDENQIARYSTLVDKHRKMLRAKDGKILKLKNSLYSSLSKSDDLKTRDSICQLIGVIQKDIEITHYNHFLDIKNLCNESQMKNFEVLIKDLTKIFNRRPHPKK